MTDRSNTRMLASMVVVGGLAMVPLLGQSQGSKAADTKTWTVPKTVDGQPDLQGMWINFEGTPFEKPDASVARGGGGGGGAFGDKKPIVPPRTSMAVDPPDGKVPVMAWAEQKREERVAHSTDSWEFLTPWEQCITRGIPAG